MPKSIRVLLCLFWLVLCTHNAHGTGTVYQVEILVFERLHQGHSREQWPKNIALEYPPGSRELVDPQAIKEQELSEQEQQDHDTVRDFNAPLEIGQEGPAPYQFLPRAERRMNSSYQALQRNNAFRVLFHEAWLQPLVEANRASPLVIRGGNEYGEHRELEGTVVVSLSRYLHLHTDLWLTQFVPNVGQYIEHWPALPLPPSAIRALYQPIDLESMSLGPLDRPAQDHTGEANPNEAWQPSERTFGWSGQPSLRLRVQESPYRIQEISTLRQRRRMRSTEVHYLDHPRMGLLIRIDPVR